MSETNSVQLFQPPNLISDHSADRSPERFLGRRYASMGEFMQSNFDVYTLSTRNLTDSANFDNCSYVGKVLVSGPDAAIDVVGDEISQFMFGSPSRNNAFQDIIDNYRKSILAAARKLRVEPDDRVTFTGVWFHVDYDQVPWFEGYVIHVTSSDGIVHTRSYDLEIFDHDRPEEGRFRIGEIGAFSQSHLEDRLLATAFGMAGECSLSTSGFPRLQGVVWYPSEDSRNKCLPIVVSKLVEIKSSDRLPEDVAALKPELNTVQREFVEAHTQALAARATSARLSAAFSKVHEMSPKMAEWVLRELQFSMFGARNNEIVVRQELDGPIKLSDLANGSDLEGYWFQVRNKDRIIQVSGYKRFDDDARMGLNDYRAIFKKQAVQSDANEDVRCELASDWHPTRTGGSVRFLAKGTDPRLTW